MTDDDRPRDSTVTKLTRDDCRFYLELSAEEVEGLARCELSEQLIAHAQDMLALADGPSTHRLGTYDVHGQPKEA